MSPAGFEPVLLVIDILPQLLYFLFETSGNFQFPPDVSIQTLLNQIVHF